jgi:hypothetical protein
MVLMIRGFWQQRYRTMIFFYPNPSFVKFMAELVGDRLLIECGCGVEGLFLQKMLQRKVKAIGIDPMFDPLGETVPPEMVTKIVPVEAETFGIISNLPNTVILTCRPCHNGFPGRINIARNSSSEQYYVGFEDKLMLDLIGAPTELIRKNVGKEKECLYKVGAPLI